MITKKTWDEFRESGLLILINQLLHAFGWAIVCNVDKDNNVIGAYPARVKFRGFNEECVSLGYKRIGQYLKDNIDEIYKESQEE